MNSLTVTAEAFKILDLNDDCLQEVFKNLSLLDLCAIADVCTRFRECAQDYSTRSPFKCLHLSVKFDRKHGFRSSFLNYSRIMRNFGASIVSFRSWYSQIDFITLLTQNNCPNLIELELDSYIDIDDFAFRMRSVLERLQKLKLICCAFSKSFWKALPLWALEMKDLEISHTSIKNAVHFEGLHQPFRKLEKISFVGVNELRNKYVGGILKHNSQLKEIVLYWCRDLDDRILQSIVKYVPNIESIETNAVNKIGSSKYFGQMNDLKYLMLGHGSFLMAAAVCEMGAANVPLRHLHLCRLNVYGATAKFIAGISKLKQLQTLKLTLPEGLYAAHFSTICTHLTQLTKLELEVDLKLTARNILELIRNARRLLALTITALDLDEPVVFDADIYSRIIIVLEGKRQKSPLKIILNNEAYTVNIPNEMARAHKDSLSIVIRGSIEG